MLHCHGTLVRHDDGGWECSADGCAGDPVRHDFVLFCADVWSGCCRPAGARRAAGRESDGGADSADSADSAEGDVGWAFRTAGAA
jgi:hypothetical protein